MRSYSSSYNNQTHAQHRTLVSVTNHEDFHFTDNRSESIVKRKL